MSAWSFCSVPTPTLVYAGPRTLEEFERIDLPENSPGMWALEDDRVLIDEQPREYRIRSKTLGELGGRKGVAVIFQWREYRATQSQAPALDEPKLLILRHALGIGDDGKRPPYRNHFVTGPGSKDYDRCMAMVAVGLMNRMPASQLTGGDDLFVVTSAGINIARATDSRVVAEEA